MYTRWLAACRNIRLLPLVLNLFFSPSLLGTTPRITTTSETVATIKKCHHSPVTMVRIPGQPPRAPRKRQPLDNMLDSVESWITERNGFVVRRRAVSKPEAPTHPAPTRRSSSTTFPISTALVLQILGTCALHHIDICFLPHRVPPLTMPPSPYCDDHQRHAVCHLPTSPRQEVETAR